MSGYIPRPIDTEQIELPSEMKELAERLAENVHDHWARQRLSQGWVHGPERSDRLKTHPCLMPYRDLPEIEKDYDRVTARETLKAILALGFEIRPRQRA